MQGRAAHKFFTLQASFAGRHGLASPWSTSHTQLWSAVRYITTPTPKKRHTDPAPLTWTSTGGELNLYEASQEPWNASAMKRHRENAAMDTKDKRTDKRSRGAHAGKEYFSKLDFMSLVFAENLLDPPSVMVYVQQKGSAVIQAFVAKHQRKLKEYIADALEWEGAADLAARAK